MSSTNTSTRRTGSKSTKRKETSSTKSRNTDETDKETEKSPRTAKTMRSERSSPQKSTESPSRFSTMRTALSPRTGIKHNPLFAHLFATQEPKVTSVSSASSSLERRACRICQSETGEMVRPCGCAGTMGDIHEACLSTWVATSNKHNCEICQEEYTLSGWRFKHPKDWSRPQLGAEDVVTLLVLAGLGFSIQYLLVLMDERQFIYRTCTLQLPLRSDDVGRIIILIIFSISLGSAIGRIFGQFYAYIIKQKEIRFTNKV